MKRVTKTGIAGIACLLLILLAGCSLLGEHLNLPEAVSSGVFIQNPAPPVCKEVSKDADLEKILSILKKADITKITDTAQQQSLSAQGWSAWIRLIDQKDENHNTLDTAWSIAIYADDVLNFEKTFYRVPKSVIEELLELYDEIDAQEQDYNDFLAEEIDE